MRSLALVYLLVALPSCASSIKSEAAPSKPAATTDKDGTTPPSDDVDPDDAPPHALGTLVLGEVRAAVTGNSVPVISASFLPDAKAAKRCTRKVGECELTDAPKCTTGTTQGCPGGQLCAFDDDCRPTCIAACTKSCQPSEECVREGTGPDDMVCRKKDRFDAGTIVFSGTSTPISLFPPYGVSPQGNGAPFMPRSQIKVEATGARRAGFAKFSETFTATTFLETDPPLSEISRSELFGGSAVTIGWVPGEDSIVVTATGAGGTATCRTEDKSGSFELSRDVLRDVIGTGDTGSGLSLAVARQRREVRRDKKTTGTLSGGQDVQPVGWLELVTTSAETHSFASCTSGQSACGETCTNLMSDIRNCGACGRACLTGQYCSSGVCR